jgi:hypothetical protein
MPTEEDEIEEQMSSDQLNCCRWWDKIDFLMKKWRTRKVDGSWFFDPKSGKIDQNWLYRDLSKIRPHKKHCAWARTPPWAKT